MRTVDGHRKMPWPSSMKGGVMGDTKASTPHDTASDASLRTDEFKELLDYIADNIPQPVNLEMMRLRAMLDEAGIEWHDDSGMGLCRTNDTGDCGWTYSAICGEHTFGEIELWTNTMIENKLDPIGLQTAEEAFELIREEVGA